MVIESGVPATVNVKLEVGQAAETVVVQGGAEVVNTTNAELSSTITGRQINELPTATRNGMESFVQLPGTQTTTGFRATYVNGLPLESINVTIDGINTNDNWLKSSDGFFSYIMPSVDSLEEVTLSTAAGEWIPPPRAAPNSNLSPRAAPTGTHGGVSGSIAIPSSTLTTISITSTACLRDLIKLNQGGGHIGGPSKRTNCSSF